MAYFSREDNILFIYDSRRFNALSANSVFSSYSFESLSKKFVVVYWVINGYIESMNSNCLFALDFAMEFKVWNIAILSFIFWVVFNEPFNLSDNKSICFLFNNIDISPIKLIAFVWRVKSPLVTKLTTTSIILSLFLITLAFSFIKT